MQCYAKRHREEAAGVRIHRPPGTRQMEDHAAHVAKQIHGAVVNNFDTETLEPLVFARKNGLHPTRMEWRQQATGEKASAREAATTYTVFCTAKCGTQTDIRTKPVRQQTGWPVVICHWCNSEYSTRTATCRRCKTVAHKCRCSTTSTHHKNEPSENCLQSHIDKTQTKRAFPASQIIQSNTRCP